MTEQLQLAVKLGRTDVVKGFLSTLQANDEDNELLKKALGEACFDGETLLHLAVKEEQIDVARALLGAGADPTVVDKEGKTAVSYFKTPQSRAVFHESLLQAGSQSNVDRVSQLIRSGVSVNFVDTEESKNTPLHWVATFGNAATIHCLCNHGANATAVNTAGCTPLHDAVNRGDTDVVRALLQHGADPYSQQNDGRVVGKTSFDLAEGKPAILSLLQNPPDLLLKESQDSLLENDTVITGEEIRKMSLANGSVPRASLSGNVKLRRTSSSLSSSRVTSPVTVPGSPQLMSPVFQRSTIGDSLSKPPQVVTEERLGQLWPQPQSIVQRDGSPFCPEEQLPIYVTVGPGAVSRKVQKCLNRYKPDFASIDLEISVEVQTPLTDTDDLHIQFHVNQRLLPFKDAYRINILANQVKVLCNSYDSVRYATATILQLMKFYRAKDEIQVPQLQIDDWPTSAYRGVLVDVSQGRVPSLETFKNNIRKLSLLKMNQVHLYTRFKNLDPIQWQPCYSKEELVSLDEFCCQYGVQLCPVIEVAPSVHYDDISSMYQEFQDFLLAFSFNEFVSIGPRLSSFLLDLGENNELSVTDCSTMLPVRSDQTLNLCGYPLHDLDRNLLKQLPAQLVFNEYGVQATHDFGQFCKPLSKHGISFFVCPGTAAWNSLAGCPEAAITNVFNAVRCASDEGALGVMICHWSGKGHMTHMPFSWPGFLIGAGLAWNPEGHWEYLLSNVEDLLNLHIFDHDNNVVGNAIIELGRAETYLQRCARGQDGADISDLPADQGSILYQLYWQPDSVVLENLTPEIFQRVTRHIKKCQNELKDVELTCPQGAEILLELQHTCDLMLLATKLGRALVLAGRNPGGQAGYNVVNLGIANLPATVKTDVANKLLQLLKTYKTLWEKRYLENGLNDSLVTLRSLLKKLIPDSDHSNHDEKIS